MWNNWISYFFHSAENTGVNPDEHELTYAAVKIVPRQGRQIKRPEMEVEYGEVKFSQRPRPPVEPAGDECVYSMVRKGRWFEQRLYHLGQMVEMFDDWTSYTFMQIYFFKDNLKLSALIAIHTHFTISCEL